MSLSRQSDDERRDHAGFRQQDDTTQCLDEADKLRTDLKAMTGYGSYAEYLDANEEIHPYFLYVLRRRWRPTVVDPRFCCFIFDLWRDPESEVHVDLRCRTSSGFEVWTNLCQPLTTSSIQVVLWSVGGFDSELVSALGLGLKIEAELFAAVFSQIAPPERTFEEGSSRALVPTYAEIGGKLITIASCCGPIQGPSRHVVLVAGGTYWQVDTMHVDFSSVWDSLESSIDRTSHRGSDPPLWWQHKNTIGDYVRLLHWCLEGGRAD